MGMIIKSIIGAVCACLAVVSFNANAAIVKYVLNGQLDHMTDRSYYYQTDLYDLDGAYYVREMIVDTSISPDGFTSGETTYWTSSPGFLISNIYHITGRPNGAADLHINTSDLSYIMSVQNAYSIGNDRHYDHVALGSAQLTGVLEDIFAADEFIAFEDDFIPGDSGYVTEPTYPFDNSDIQAIVANVWNYAPGGSTGTIDGKYLQYEQINLSAYASPVPIPAAVWLFGSGLIGLIGLVRKN